MWRIPVEGSRSDDQEKDVMFSQTRIRDWEHVLEKVDEFRLGFEMQRGSELRLRVARTREKPSLTRLNGSRTDVGAFCAAVVADGKVEF